MKAEILLLPGDGIGPEVIDQARQVLGTIAIENNHEFNFSEQLIGGCAIDAFGDPFPTDTLAACRNADAILLGAVGGPKWDDPLAAARPEQGLLRLRKELELYANLRPVHPFPELEHTSSLRADRIKNVDIMIVRELTGGIYFGQPSFREEVAGRRRAIDTLEYSEDEILRILRKAFQLARDRRGKVTSVDKANVLETSRLWRQLAQETAQEFPEVILEHQLVDSAAMLLIQAAETFDVIVTGNMFGDILSDEASVLVGSLGMMPSASLGDGGPGVYEPVHGSAPDIVGKGLANPIGAILSAAMLLRFSLHLEDEAQRVEQAVELAIAGGARTADLIMGPALSTEEMGDAIQAHL